MHVTSGLAVVFSAIELVSHLLRIAVILTVRSVRRYLLDAFGGECLSKRGIERRADAVEFAAVSNDRDFAFGGGCLSMCVVVLRPGAARCAGITAMVSQGVPAHGPLLRCTLFGVAQT